MSPRLRLAFLVDNAVRRAELRAEHGLSIWIEYGEKKILFDTGQSDLFLDNARLMNIPAHSPDRCIISHAHYDHADGLAHLTTRTTCEKVLLNVPPDLFSPLFSDHGSSVRFVGAGFTENNLSPVAQIEPVADDLSLSENVRIIHTRTADRNYYRDRACSRQTSLHELSLLIGTTLFTGCSHSGIETIIDAALQYGPVHTVIGGLHLLNADTESLRNTARKLMERNIRTVYTAHCSGPDACCIFRETGLDTHRTFVGRSIEIAEREITPDHIFT